MNDLERELRELRELIGDNPYKNQQILYDYIQKEIRLPKKGQVYICPKECYDCRDDLVYKPEHSIKKTFWGTGNKNADIMFVLINPAEGKTDVNSKLKGITEGGVNLTGRGAILRWVAKLAGYKNFDDNIFATNSFKCCTKGNKESKEARVNCRKYLKDEIKDVKPKKIAVFGRKPMKSIRKICKDEKHPISKGGGKTIIDGNAIEIKFFYHYENVVINPRGRNQVKCRYGNYLGWMKEIISFIAK